MNRFDGKEYAVKKPLILVTGANGTVGSETVRQLAMAGHRVRALVRDRAKAKQIEGAGEIAVADLARPETLPAVFAGVDAAFVISTGPELATLEGNAFQAAKDAGVAHIVKLSGRHLDADFMEGVPLARWHNESEQRLKALGVSWTILRPGYFSSNVLMLGVKEKGGIFLPTGAGRDTPIDPRDIAAVAVKTLTTSGHSGAIYELTGPEWLSHQQMAEKIGAVTGRTINHVDVPEAALREGLIANGIAPAYVDSTLRYFAAVKAGNIFPPTSAVAELLGRPACTFDDWVRDNVAALR